MNTNHTIRQASTEDIPAIKRLADETWEPTYKSILSKEQIDYMFEVIYSEAALEAQMKEGQTFLLLLEEAQPVGFAAYSVKDAEASVYKLNKIYLLPQTQGKGYGKILLQEVEQQAKKAGAAILDLNVNRHNNAKAFYERAGYHVHQQEDIAIGPYWMNDYVMRKAL
ncbi:GNAT family N-acetyltransferase [Pontibacter akesuensis]|uniref:Ribosomal protein S18 acetylase RimI n=1 Tax=Pontibacter akesuensis TaxID=388950 RepID=A0A1I7JYA9_9BACT|nr:GNAT family N-acetyltransferase [Pontibacter akesuensis]GHA76553.1 N-acetyltransferase [Pontibacter akesuensis]SFU90203.1 Ribosomal protein S18 acetylase RimI [Pontibacter akesuensis]